MPTHRTGRIERTRPTGEVVGWTIATIMNAVATAKSRNPPWYSHVSVSVVLVNAHRVNAAPTNPSACTPRRCVDVDGDQRVSRIASSAPTSS